VRSEPDRDVSIERELRRSLRSRRDVPATSACLEADTLAALVDGALPKGSRPAAEEHLADCPRCQAIAAGLLRLADEDAHPPGLRPWWRAWRWPWVVPLAAGALALAVWIAVPRPSVRPDLTPLSSSLTVASASRDAVPPAPAKPGALQTGRIDRAEARPLDSRRPLHADNAERRPVNQDRPAALAPENDAAAQAPENDAAAQLARREDSRAEPVGKSAVAAPPPAAPVPSAAAAATTSALALRRLSPLVGGTLEVATPDPAIRWRVGVRGFAQRSTDGGATWETLTTGVTSDLTAASAPGESVTWIVGRAGTVLLTTDGREFRRITFPDSADLVTVRATDARSAIVTTADGRQFRTADGGMTWTR
jgi:hypothetical protein